MTRQRRMLLESLSGHLALLNKARPKQAASPLAKRTRRYIRTTLRGMR